MDFIDNWLESLSGILGENLYIGVIIALVAGVLTSFTPCSLSSVPLIIGYVGGYTDNKKKALYYSVMFCVGMAITFTIIGVFAALIGRLFFSAMRYWYAILGALMAVMALQSFGVINILPSSCGGIKSRKKGTLGAIMLGALGAVFSSPCSTPVLIAILALVSTGQSIYVGALMLFLYSVGHSVLIIISGTSVGLVTELNKSEKFEKTGKIIKCIMGTVLLILSLYLFYSAFR